MVDPKDIPEIMSVAGEDRIRDFFARHGGAGNRHEREGDVEQHSRGWSEVYAADGYKLRCDWSQSGGRTQMTFSEVAPALTDAGQ